MSAAHTPGPWKAGRGIDDDSTRCFVTQGIPGRPEYLIAKIENGAIEDSLDTEKANARLIAAAPELLAALKVARDLMEAADFADADEIERQALSEAQAAITKAEGHD